MIVTLRDGATISVPASQNSSVMETLRDNGVDEVLALCGGCLSCASCHVYIREDFLSIFAPPSDMELELLDESPHKRANSRLSCQLKLPENPPEVALTIPPED